MGTVSLALLAGAGLLVARTAAGSPAAAGEPASSGSEAALQTLQIVPDLYLLAGAGANIVVQTGPDGTVMVDGGTAASAQAVRSALARITTGPIRYIIDTSADADVVGGTGVLAAAGSAPGRPAAAPATILAPISVLLRVSAPTGQLAPFPSAVWPSQAFDAIQTYIYLNHETVQIYRQAAHDNTDSIVMFRAADVIAAGDVIDADHFPVIDIAHGGSIQGEIAALNHLLELSDRPIPYVYQSGGTYIIPGHGRIYQQADVVQYRDMLVIIRSIIQRMMARGLSLAQIESAAPCLGYETEYGSDSGAWTTHDFIRAVYQSLTAHGAHGAHP